ncbi:AtpZ/AtpI family protein [Peptococcaceae bacterium 1198_IL3148]
MDDNRNKGKGAFQALAITSTIGVELGITSTLGFYGGRYLDEMLGTTPVFLVICLLLGLGVGVMGIIKTINAFFKDNDDKGVK